MRTEYAVWLLCMSEYQPLQLSDAVRSVFNIARLAFPGVNDLQAGRREWAYIARCYCESVRSSDRRDVSVGRSNG